MKLCYAAIGRAGGNYCALDPFPAHMHTRKVISPDWILATRVRGNDSAWPEPFAGKGDTDIRVFAENLWHEVKVPFQNGKLKLHPARKCEGGFEGILDSLDVIRRGEVSGEKLVYTIGK